MCLLNNFRTRVWAEYCFPNEDWSTEESLRNLYRKNKVICSKHFDDSSYTNSSRTRLNNFAIPIGAESIRLKLCQEQSVSTILPTEIPYFLFIHLFCEYGYIPLHLNVE